ncbi:molecular chaperone (plasmid) [Brucella anthropi]|uniref:Putataive fimbrial chaperone protein n=1 Tax=Brucella anthropi (strain ATCC 49188 / DSM 6882 / CCUG 24695 / JCM 21032 / LMG 3331 / NBRC 15819 / NCTC 12168 / Alc 37) TaxID=439375 RepID=A6X8A5_BRUA4|nr:molecular chaperone [Brucella anthropi]ABS17459.1 putataive fimbrial chaperone protein [Brucella anthropi ATCC 49188]KAB2723335.1 molecular chaperone [Brucella anthropi]QQC26953.1 molecular chaperone [Brucella anthropi]SUB55935.1 putative fimbrial chaperone protein [Brucella anthropi]SUB56041.1 putative fimbrial chaperone protein [Brucella anthropi]
MRSMLRSIVAATLLLLGSSISANAASLRLAPTTLELFAPDSAAVLNLRNEAKYPLNVQVRVFRWIQQGGVEQLEPTSDVVASPPSTSLPPNADYVVRILRVNKTPVKKEESYRVVVDELPDPSRRKAGTVSLVVRHVIPVFFRTPDAGAPEVSWSLARSGGSLMLVARNAGGTTMRLSDVKLSQGGKAVASRKGLVGYVLAGATMQWPIGSAKRLGGGPVKRERYEQPTFSFVNDAAR